MRTACRLRVDAIASVICSIRNRRSVRPLLLRCTAEVGRKGEGSLLALPLSVGLLWACMGGRIKIYGHIISLYPCTKWSFSSHLSCFSCKRALVPPIWPWFCQIWDQDKESWENWYLDGWYTFSKAEEALWCCFSGSIDDYWLSVTLISIFKKTITSGSERMSIHDAKTFKYSCYHPQEIWVKYCSCEEGPSHKFKIEKRTASACPTFRSEQPYLAPLPLSQEKVDVAKLVYKYVPHEFRQFYDDLIAVTLPEMDSST